MRISVPQSDDWRKYPTKAMQDLGLNRVFVPLPPSSLDHRRILMLTLYCCIAYVYIILHI